MKRNRISMLASTALLSIFMLVWADLYCFSKEVTLPEWAKFVPSPIHIPEYLTLLSLIPAAFFTTTVLRAVQSVIISVFVAPLFAVASHALNSVYPDSYLLVVNLLGHYGFIVVWHCTVPVILLLGIRWGYQLRSKAHGYG